MKAFSILSPEEKRKIIFERITSIFTIDREELKTLIDPSVLTNRLDEFPPIMLGFSIETASAFSKDLPLLQQMYLYAYKLHGLVKFGYNESLNIYHILFDFTITPLTMAFNKTQSHLRINGFNGLRFCRIMQLSNIGSSSLAVMPSLTLTIKKDGQEVKKQSITTMMNLFQVNSEIVTLNYNYEEFEALDIHIEDNSGTHDYNIVFAYY